MAYPASHGKHKRDIEQALIALKKRTPLIKCSRKGKPKFCPFRISTDETTLIWYSHGEERSLTLSSISQIIPGQRTAVFRQYLLLEKDYLSFSLLYNDGERSLDLICKDKAEAEVWFAGLKPLISAKQQHSRRTISDIPDFNKNGDFILNGRPSAATLDITSNIDRSSASLDWNSCESPLNSSSSDVVSVHPNMQLRTSSGDGVRFSVSSTPSCSSGGSGLDDIELLGDIYVWGEVLGDGILPDGSVSPIPLKTDVLTPKSLESNVVLDVHQIACGVQHVALVTRQGEVFTWGEESGGRLGHGIDKDFSHPHLVEFLAVTNIDFVACGEYHTCAVSTSGDLFTWGDGTHNAGLLGHGTDISHWIPKRVAGPIEGLQVLSVACGTWHSALATSNGKLFTFGDGTYGVLGHGDRESVSYPKEVQSLSGLKTTKVACGVWHTAAIVEVAGLSGSNVSSKKLFTWGDGDKHRLGHGSKEAYLVPTCVSSLIDYNFHQLACGHTLTVALTSSGHVFTMGGTVYGQLGNPCSDGKVPCLVQDKLVGEFVEEIACGAYHVAVLTSRSEVYTWGKGANGRLGHGDKEDHKYPTLVEALKDRHVKNIYCGSNFTSSICIHKWVSGADQSVCSGCRQAFGFTRKRHNCYNCGLVHCHACSSRKALKAALAPTPGKPHRVCDACYAKLKIAETGSTSNVSRKTTTPHRSMDSRENFDKGEVRSSRILLSPTSEPVKYLEIKSEKPGSRSESPSIGRVSKSPSSLGALQNALKPVMPSSSHPTINSRPASPYSRKLSPPHSPTPTFSRSFIDGLRKTNELLNQEVSKLQNQVKYLKHKCDMQDVELKNLHRNAKQAASLAKEEASKCRIAREIVKSIAEQLNEVIAKVPPYFSDDETFKAIHYQVEAFLTTTATSDISSSLLMSLESDQQYASHKTSTVNESSKIQGKGMQDHIDIARVMDLSAGGRNTTLQDNKISSISNTGGALSHQSSSTGSRSELSTMRNGEKEVIEQFEPGVYVTVLLHQNGVKIFHRVRFSKRRFNEHQAEEWWSKNKDRILRRYSQPTASLALTGSSNTSAPADEGSSCTQAPADEVSSSISAPADENNEASASSKT